MTKWCEMCGYQGRRVEATHEWGMDLSLLCDIHYEVAERNYLSWEVE